jgi:hypothetical protein
MRVTFTTPRGHRVETRTVRRYALIRETVLAAAVTKRSDSMETLAGFRRRQGVSDDVDHFIGTMADGTLRRVHGTGRVDTVVEAVAAGELPCGNPGLHAVAECICYNAPPDPESPPFGPTVDTQVWEPVLGDQGQETGYIRWARNRTIREVFADLESAVGESGPGHNEYFMPSVALDKDGPWPGGRDGQTIVYALNGGSEGWYTRVCVIDGETGKLHHVLTGKTFDGAGEAQRFAASLAELLGVCY